MTSVYPKPTVTLLKAVGRKPSQSPAGVYSRNETLLSTPVRDPVLSTPARDPVLSTPVRDPVLSTPVRDPVLSTPVRNPVLSTPVRDPVLSTPVRDPVLSTAVRDLLLLDPCAGCCHVPGRKRLRPLFEIRLAACPRI